MVMKHVTLFLVLSFSFFGFAKAKEWSDPTTKMVFVWVPGGSFPMGCHAKAGKCGKDEKPVRTVRLDGFWIGKHEVTVGHFKMFAKDSGNKTQTGTEGDCWGKRGKIPGSSWRNPGFQQGPNHPVACVSWDDADSFAIWLSGKTGKSFSLPSEAQWEFACRAGGKPVTFGTADGKWDSQAGNARGIKDGHNRTAPVGSFPPNGLGLHDMSGNVWEWVKDLKSSYGNVGTTNPIYEDSGIFRVIRGGSWNSPSDRLRCSYRRGFLRFSSDNHRGFRLVRVK